MTAARYARRRRYVSRRAHRRGVRVVTVPGGVSGRLAVTAVIAGGLAGYWLSPARGVEPMTPDTVPPCLSDDGSGPRPCFWDATRRGNGAGVSFLVDGSGRVFYADGSTGEGF